MSRPLLTQVLASRPSVSAVACLFAEQEETAGPRSAARRRDLRTIGRDVLGRIERAFLQQLPCDDITFDASLTPRA